MKFIIHLYSIKGLEEFKSLISGEEVDEGVLFEVHFDDSDEIYTYSAQEKDGKFYIVTA